MCVCDCFDYEACLFGCLYAMVSNSERKSWGTGLTELLLCEWGEKYW